MDPASLPQPHLSVALIVRNCDALLARTLASVRGLADEIVVLDTGSTDDTLHVALEAGAVVHRRPWDDSFAAARNACLAKITGQWVLWLDAGETIDAGNAAALRQLVSSAASLDKAHLLTVALPADPGQVGAEHAARLRLHPHRDGLQFVGRVRERLDASLLTLGMTIEAGPVEIHRTAAPSEAAEKVAKAQRNIRLADLALTEHGPAADLHNCLGEAFQSLADPMRAAQHYRRALELSAADSRERLEAFYGLLTCLEGHGSDRTAQLTLCMSAIEQFPLDAQLLVALGGYLQSLGHRQLAVRAFDVAFRHGQIEPQIWHLPEIREIAAACAAGSLQQLGEETQAQTLLEAAVRAHPQSLRLGRQLVELHVLGQRRDDALAAVATLPGAESRDALAAAVRGACLAQQAQWPAARDFLQAAVEAGCRERFCLQAFVVACLQLGQPADAVAMLRMWESLDPRNPELAILQSALAEQTAQLPLAPTVVQSGSVRVDNHSHYQKTKEPKNQRTEEPRNWGPR